MSDPTDPATRRHRLVPMSGRDPREEHRASTPLELLFDLTLVVAFSAASDELAHLLSEGVVGGAVLGFMIAMFATVWPWINYTWFASAYDTDDWAFRLLTMVQMFGVLVIALGMPQFFESVALHETPDNRVVIAGYVVMRVAMAALWLRAARADEVHRAACRAYAVLILVVQAGWVLSGVVELSFGVEIGIAAVLFVAEMAVPKIAESQGEMTPWHADHIVERYGLLAIIALGEGVLGTTASISAVVQEQGWSVESLTVGFAGVALIFGMWWVYFAMPAGDVLRMKQESSFVFGYGHILVYAAIAAVGAGLHVAAYFVEGASELGEAATVMTVAVPYLVFMALVFWVDTVMIRSFDLFHLLLLAATVVVLGAGVALAAAGAPIEVALLVVAAAPWVSVVGYETVGHRQIAEHLRRLGA